MVTTRVLWHRRRVSEQVDQVLFAEPGRTEATQRDGRDLLAVPRTLVTFHLGPPIAAQRPTPAVTPVALVGVSGLMRTSQPPGIHQRVREPF
jgi:hypothetical protein